MREHREFIPINKLGLYTVLMRALQRKAVSVTAHTQFSGKAISKPKVTMSALTMDYIYCHQWQRLPSIKQKGTIFLLKEVAKCSA